MKQKLFMLLLGCKPKGRLVEQHDVFFGIAPALKDLVPEIITSWPEAEGKIHIDVWREIQFVDGRRIEIVSKDAPEGMDEWSDKVFFLNLGGYKDGEFEENHYKKLVLAENLGEAVTKIKGHSFFKSFQQPHIDNKYAFDVDDIFDIEDLFLSRIKENYKIRVSGGYPNSRDTLHTGMVKLSAIDW